MPESVVKFNLPKDALVSAVRDGVRDALSQALANVDVYAAVREGAASTVRMAAREQAPEATSTVSPDEPGKD